jgi:arginine decarboxylase
MMEITICSGTGTGETTLAAFDNALKNAGIYNYNLVKLSSIIPPRAVIKTGKYEAVDEFGNKLYVVLAEERTDLLGRSIAAGIGWYQWDDGRGVFAEHHDIIEALNAKEAEKNVQKKLETTVRNLCEFRNISFNKRKINTIITSKEVKTKPTCTLVAAVYKSESW